MLPDFAEGAVLLINKPYTWTSFDVVGKVRKATGVKKVGHAGTLDPLATGLLIVCTGKMTKTIMGLQGLDKEYTGTFTLGATTPSYDMETQPDQEFPVDHITPALMDAAIQQLSGKIQQIPPLHSAKNINGERAYHKARRGEQLELKPNEVEIKAFEITAVRGNEVDFRVLCSKGTYIRSLARDFGTLVNSGAYLSALCRTRIGDYALSDACEIKDLVAQIQEQRARAEGSEFQQ